LFLCFPVLLWLFGASLTSPESFASFKPCLRCCRSRLFWLV
jgi:hypothetical protein